MRIDIVTLFPELCDTFLSTSILGRARNKGLFEAHCHQIRDYTQNKQRQTDDYPYGGGCGMVLYAQPIADCLREVIRQCAEQGRPRPHIVFLTAAGQPYKEETTRRLAACDSLTLVCGHYEGIDERVIEEFGDEEISIGDYVLTGGELASLVVADSVLRLQPGVLAEEQGYQEESYWDNLLEYPQYTRPEVWEGRPVPPVLLTGDHDRIQAWRGRQSRERTRTRRPDLYLAWCESHPITRIPRWKRTERACLVRDAAQMEAAARLAAEARRTLYQTAGVVPGSEPSPQTLREELENRRREGWAFYLHSMSGTEDGLVGVCHKTGQIGYLAVTEPSRGIGIGTRLLDFARKKLAEHDAPWVAVPQDNLALIGLLIRMDFRAQTAANPGKMTGILSENVGFRQQIYRIQTPLEKKL
ncbi:MAG: tRNA (guanosine(37)-N1)-methyltransferase TrmD [Gemmiger sp.]|uniref:tRNA (guanosine(37)-N1)-methyltransferase TrmD n=1 Tax=Gemmiger sp. TaxID=2049027 RepID=UPI002E79D03F|nr:tRNA (guanosine(37)-N1)-methyltransferase TrmD [Gemmiger sp.]MEE0800485.1 tRNA (guanosine(37)-N1)-methyltransferase TrmD [Gemmiger sp.]